MGICDEKLVEFKGSLVKALISGEDGHQFKPHTNYRVMFMLKPW